jgi:flagellar biosynthesis protein FlhF
MRVKRYVARTLQEAMDKIRVELGKDAVILNTKRLRTGGFLGLFKKEEIEVIAAVDTDRAKAVNPSPQLGSHILPSNSVPAAQEHLLFEDRTHSLHIPGQAEHVRTRLPDQEILQEVKEMREMMQHFLNQRGEELNAPSVFKRAIDRLKAQGVEPQIIAQMMDGILKKHKNEEIKEEEVFPLVKNEITSFLANHFTGALHPSTRLLHIVGPTGVGKTTTIAKLAANFMLKHNKKVGLITSDTYRIAAVEQLRTYANILNIPLEVVYNEKEVKQAISQLIGNDIIIMDTAGRNYRNKEYVKELSNLLAATIPAETILVLSLTAKYEDMVAIVRQFAELKVNKVIFTKLDETATYGSILNLLLHHNFYLSYMTNGQTVPDDLFVANPDLVAGYILGGEKNA